MATQPSLFDLAPVPRFDGPGLEPQDTERLVRQLDRVRDYMLKVRDWRTLEQIAKDCKLVYTAGISSRVRDLKKRKFGGYPVEKRQIAPGLWVYRIPPEVKQ